MVAQFFGKPFGQDRFGKIPIQPGGHILVASAPFVGMLVLRRRYFAGATFTSWRRLPSGLKIRMRSSLVTTANQPAPRVMAIG